jgi:metal-responsive CopG/Arc/MetJ family transcriptional regulator
MAVISLKLPDELISESDRHARERGLSRAEYIRQAIQQVNREAQRDARSRRLAEISHRVRKESMRVNAEFAAIERDSVAE